MKIFDENIGKYISKRKMNRNSISDAAILLETISKLQGGKLIPKGVYKFSTFEEADEWALKMIAGIQGRQS